MRDKLDDCYLGPSTAAIVAAATDRRIPHIRLNDGNLVQLGHGARQRRIWTAETDMTSAIAEGIAGDKDLTKTLLKAVGVPVPARPGGQERPPPPGEAAQDIGLPVVIKPSDGNHGRGVTLDIARTRPTAPRLSSWRTKKAPRCWWKAISSGNEHRILVVGGQVVAAARGEAAWIHGDGQPYRSPQLIDLQINTDPRRGLTEDFPLNKHHRSAKTPSCCWTCSARASRPSPCPPAGQEPC